MRASAVLLGLTILMVGGEHPAAAQVARRTGVAAIQDSVPPLQRVVSLDMRDVTLGEALKEIDRRAQLGLAYTPRVVPVERRVTLRAKQVTAGEALTHVLAGTGVEVTVSADGAVMLVRSAARETRARGNASGNLTGQVTDSATGRGLAGAELILDGTRWRTTSDSAGRYRLADVDPGTYLLMARRLGYAKQSRRVTIRAEGADTVDLALHPVALPLDELVSTVTGPQQRRDIGYAVTTIKVDSVLQNSAARRVTDLLQNRVPGLTVQHTSGAPGDPAKLRFHGLNSVLRSNDPVIIVDGVRLYSAQSEARSGNLTNLAPSPVGVRPSDFAAAHTALPAPSPLDQIDPNMIEKIETFSGPAASTLYGPDAANGVIVITTKKGRPGPTQWTANYRHARTTPPGQFPTGYYRFGHRVGQQEHQSELCTILVTICVQDSVVAFQFLNEPALTILDVGHTNDLSLSARGGNQALTFALTGSYSDELGPLKMPTFAQNLFATTFNRSAPDWMQRPHHYTTWSVTSNVSARLGATAEVSLLAAVGRSEQQRSSLEQRLSSLMSTYADTVNDAYYPAPSPTCLSTPGCGREPIHLDGILRDYYLRTTASALTFKTGAQAQWRPRAWLQGTAQANLDLISRDDGALLPDRLIAATDSGYLSHATGRSIVGSFRLYGRVQKGLGRGLTFVTTAGTDLTTTATADVVASAAGLIPGTSSLAGARRFQSFDQATNTSVFGWFLEPNLAAQRFNISTGFRLDGGSAYGARVTSGGLLGGLLALPKLNGTWMISEEPWFPFGGIFSSLRLRAGYGQAQVQPGVTDRLRLYEFGGTEAPAGSLGIQTLGNTALRPERSTEINGGFDADVLASRASVQLNFYRKRQVDALMNASLPPSVNGGGTLLFNLGNIRNTGFDVTLDLTPVRSRVMTWHTQLLYNRNTNLLEQLGPGVVPNKVNGWVAGYPVGSRWAKPILGFADQNGDGVLQMGEIQVGDSLEYMGRLYPAYTTAWSTDVVLFGGAINVAAGFSYEHGATQVNQTARNNWVLEPAFSDPRTPLAQQAAVFATIPTEEIGAGILDPRQTDYGLIQDLSTFRFQSLSVRYQAPTPVARLLRVRALSVQLAGSNLALHTTYKGKDPDVSAWGPGESVVDTGQLPLPRLWQVSVNLRY